MGWIAIDILVILISYAAAYSARAVTTPLDPSRGLGFMVFVIIVNVSLLGVFGAYNRIWSRSSGHDVALFVWAFALAVPILLVANMLSRPYPLPTSVLLFGSVLALVGFVAVRYRSRLISGFSWRWQAIWHHQFPPVPIPVLIVGAGEAGQTTAWRLKHRCPPDQSYRVVGFVDDDPAKQGMYIEGSPILGPCQDIPDIVERNGVELIVISIHNISGSDFRRVLSYCERTAARIRAIPNMFDLLGGNNGSPLLQDITPEDLLGRKPIVRHENVDLGLVTHKVILVTGAAGSIGSELSRQLITYDPVKLILLDNNESNLHDLVIELSAEGTDKRVIPVLVDITDKRMLSEVFANHLPQIVFHAAAYKHVPMLEDYPIQAVRVNIGGTRNLTQLASEYYVERFVLISTDKAVNPSSVMGASKRICELLAQAAASQKNAGTLFTSVRFGNVLGSRGSVVPIFNRQIEAGGPVTVTHKDMSRYFMTIPEAANLVIHAACLTEGNDLFMLKMGDEVRIMELAERLIRMRGLRPHIDIEIKFSGIRPGEKLHEELYAGTETLVETRHPDIVQLVDHQRRFEAEAFLRQLDRLMAQEWNNPADHAAQLFAIANGAAEPASADRAQTAYESVRLPEISPNSNGNIPSKERDMNIPMSAPDISQADIDAVNEVLLTRWLSLGPKLGQFEESFASYVGTRGAVGVYSGTCGLHLAMIAAGVGRGDEVITPSFSFVASSNCIVYTGAKPVFVDIDPMTYNLYPLALEEAITSRTKAIIVVHAFGQPADMDSIREIARAHNLLVIEDACEAIGSEYNGTRAGTMSDAAVFAFYPNKQMTTGEGGMIVTDNEEWLELFSSLRNQGRDVFNAWLSHARLGYNYRMDEMSAALGLSQLSRIDTLLENRARVANWYNERLEHLPGIIKPYIAPSTTRMSWFVYVVRCADHVDRDRLMGYLEEKGVPSRPYFTPIHLQPFYSRQYEFARKKLIQTEKAGAALLALPFSGVMTENQVDYVCEQINLGVAHAEKAPEKVLARGTRTRREAPGTVARSERVN